MGQQLLPVREFAQEAGVNPNTVQRAFQELEKEGLVYSARTSGRFVTEDEKLIENCVDGSVLPWCCCVCVVFKR